MTLRAESSKLRRPKPDDPAPNLRSSISSRPWVYWSRCRCRSTNIIVLPLLLGVGVSFKQPHDPCATAPAARDAQHSRRADDQEPPEIAVAHLADANPALLPAAAVGPRGEPEPGSELPAGSEKTGSGALAAIALAVIG